MKQENIEPRRSKKRLLILLLLLLVTGVMLSTSTYAWFTANESVSVSNIRVNVAATNGVQISADAQNWKSILQTTDLTSARTGVYGTAVNQIPAALEPVSTVGDVTDGKLDMWFGQVVTSNNNFVLTASKAGEKDNNDESTVENSGKFISFDLFLKVNSADTKIYLTSASGITTDDVNDKGIKNASRVAFLVLGNGASTADIATLQALGNETDSLHDDATPLAKIWEPNYDDHTPDGIVNMRDTYHIAEENLPSADDNTLNTIIPYDGIKAGIAANENVLLGSANKTAFASKFDTVNLTYSTKEDWTGTPTMTYLDFATLAAGVTKVRVYVWVEGQDVDCENNASGGNIIFNLQLTTNNPNATSSSAA